MKKTLCLLLLTVFCSSNAFAQTPIYGSTRAQVEPHIAVNPTDPNNLIAVTITQVTNTPNQIAVYYSFNAGQTWSEVANLSGTPSAGDPVIAFDGDGIAYALYQVIDASGLYLRKSTDGGATWASAVTVTLFDPLQDKVDRPWMAISPLRNSNGYFDIYISHTLFDVEFGSNSSIIRLLKSTNQGVSFSQIHTTSSSSGVSQGSSVAVGPDGEVFLAWAGLNAATNAVEIVSMKRSTDGGNTFSYLNNVTAYQIGQKAGNDYFLKSQQVRADSYPRLAIDRSPGSNLGFAFITWSGKQSSIGNPDILMVRWKKNAGGSFEWSAVETIDQSAGDQWMPAVEVSPDGVVSVLYYSSQIGASDPIYTYLKNSANGGASFSSPIPVGMSSGFTISGTTFLGDYHGVANWFGKAHAVWCENRDHGANDDRQLYFRTITQTELTPSGYKYVTVDQVDEANQSFEKIGRWNQGVFTNYKAPHRFLFQSNPSSNEVVRAKQDFKSGTAQKYNKWSVDNNVVNHRTFIIDPLTPELESQFKTANNATLRTEVIDGGSLNIEFRDPWLIDDSDSYGPKNRGKDNALWYSKTSPFAVTTADPNYKGIFLNENPLFDPTKPIYSVRPTNQTVNGLPWFFWNWVTTNATVTQPTSSETPVVFTASNADVKARVKLRLGSSLSSATAANGQRKLVYTNTSPAKFHLVYESAGEIYYTFSTDNGATWSNEIMLSSNDGNNKYPSLAAYQNKIYVVWQRTTSTNNYTVYVRRYTGSSWAGRQTLGSASLTTGNNPLPVITLKEILVGGLTKIRGLAVWKGASALRFRTSDDDGATWATEASVAGTSSSNKNPSLSAGLFFDYAYQDAYLTYDQSNTIRLNKYSIAWGTSEVVPGSSSNSASASHVIAQDTESLNGHAHIVWQGIDLVSGLEGVFYQRKSGIDGSWSAVQSYVDDGYRLPVITHLASNNLALYWDRSGLVYKASYTYSTNSWSASQNFATGQYPTLSAAFGSSHPTGKSAYVVNSSAPYKVQIGTETLQKGTEGNGTYSRRVAVADTAGAIFIVNVSDVYFRSKGGDTKPLGFVAVDDTLLTLPPEDYWSYLETQAAGITSEEDSLIAEINV